MINWLSILGGWALILITMLDVFLTVMYARIGSGMLSEKIAEYSWLALRGLSRRFMFAAKKIRAFSGPIILILVFTVWIAGLVVGSGLILWPSLGMSLISTEGPTPTDFWTALTIGGDSLTTVGIVDFSPQTLAMRLFLMFGSFIGISTLTLMVTYLLQVYNALKSRTTFGLKLHLASGGTGDAAELVKRMFPPDESTLGYSQLSEAGAEVVSLHESHHFYPVLFYFRFHESHYATIRALLICLDVVALVRHALATEDSKPLKNSAAIDQLYLASIHMLKQLSDAFLREEAAHEDFQASENELNLWRRRFHNAVDVLQAAGLTTRHDLEVAQADYIAERCQWNHYIVALSEHLDHELTEVDPATYNTNAAAA